MKRSIRKQLANLGITLCVLSFLKVARIIVMNPYFLVIALLAVLIALTILTWSDAPGLIPVA